MSEAALSSGYPSEVLVVDLDGTLTPSDSLVEGLLHVARERPSGLPRVLVALSGGRAAFKQAVCDAVALPADTLPYRDDLLAHLRSERERGRRIVLATAADHRVAEAVAAHLGVFDEVLATRGGLNLKGAAKLAAIRERYGADFIYAGDSRADLAVWQGAQGAILVGRGCDLRQLLGGRVPVLGEFGTASSSGVGDWLRALRLHQWLKNVLLFVPLLTGDVGLGLESLGLVMAAFLSFSLLASATYLVNDLLDLPSDRKHPSKRLRPMASGRIGIMSALGMALTCLAAALGLALVLPAQFGWVLLSYWLITTAYSVALKRYVLVDVLTLAVLYTTRIVAGAAVLSIIVSPWLLAFSATVFLSLALVKRCSELSLMERQGRSSARGRDYNVKDIPVLQALGASSAVSAVLVFGLFISQPLTVQRYAHPDLLWLAALALSYWLGRLWIKTSRGEMHDDPLVYTLTDRGCRLTLAAVLCVSLVARFSLPGLAA
jgi:4-hydroxybenzoate polyprenyltransferase/phosphoserine phosphatase